MFQFLPLINRIFPGSGLTVFTVWECTYEWWRRYVDAVVTMIEQAGDARG